MLKRPLIEAAGLIRLPSQHPDGRYDYYLGAGLDTPKIRIIFIFLGEYVFFLTKNHVHMY